MSIIPYDAMRYIDNLRREIDRIYRSDFTFFNSEKGSDGVHLPFLDIYETDKEIIASCDLPGIQNKEDISIDIENNVLTITGTINKTGDSIKENRMHQKERFSGSFRRSVTLPSNVSKEKARAIYQYGVLNVYLPKKDNEPQQNIDIEFQH